MWLIFSPFRVSVCQPNDSVFKKNEGLLFLVIYEVRYYVIWVKTFPNIFKINLNLVQLIEILSSLSLKAGAYIHILSTDKMKESLIFPSNKHDCHTTFIFNWTPFVPNFWSSNAYLKCFHANQILHAIVASFSINSEYITYTS